MSSISSTDTTCSSAGRRPQGTSEHHAWGQALRNKPRGGAAAPAVAAAQQANAQAFGGWHQPRHPQPRRTRRPRSWRAGALEHTGARRGRPPPTDFLTLWTLSVFVPAAVHMHRVWNAKPGNSPALQHTSLHCTPVNL